MMEGIFVKIFDMGMQAGWLILAVAALRLLLKKSPRWIFCFLWGLVAIRLICPVSPESNLSLVPQHSLVNELMPNDLYLQEGFVGDHPMDISNGNDTISVPSGISETAYEEADGLPEEIRIPYRDNGQPGNIWITIGCVLWLCGMAGMLGYAVFSFWRLHRRVQTAVRLQDNVWQSEYIQTPFILGMIRPRIYLPVKMAPGCYEPVLAHERAHLKRLDHWWKPLGFVILSVYWFCPLCWLAYILLCRDIEAACDELVIRNYNPVQIKEYAGALLACSMKHSVVAACPVAFGEVGVKERIKGILQYKKPALWLVLVSVIACIGVAVCFCTNPVAAGGTDSSASDTTEEIPSAIVLSEERVQETEQETGQETEHLMQFLQEWAQAFISRDGNRISEMASLELLEDLKNRELLSGAEGHYSFGMSSPWPVDVEADWQLYTYDDSHAVIEYYAMTSDPHITVWREELTYRWQDGRCLFTEENLVCYDSISTWEEYSNAYHFMLDDSRMNYVYNGLGDALNENALLSSSMYYADLFAPESAAMALLNLSNDPEKIQISRHEADDSEEDGWVNLDITFYEDNGTARVTMIQPWGKNGIWIPRDFRIDVVGRFMRVPWSEVEALNFTGEMPGYDQILCIGELPAQGIKVYGYNDEESFGQGVAIEIDGNVNYYDWYYMSPRCIFPQLYWDVAKNQLQMAVSVYSGTGVAAQKLYVIQQYDTGTLQPSEFDYAHFTALLEERIDYRFADDTNELTLIDTMTQEPLGSVNVTGGKVTRIELGCISSFVLGDQIVLQVTPGYMTEEYAIALYEEIPVLEVQILMDASNMKTEGIKFDLGEIRMQSPK